jgi:predicted nucleotidyltransferase
MAIDIRSRLGLSDEALAQFCRKWKIVRLELFGSALREDFTPESDIDLLVTFDPDAHWSLVDHVRMEDQLAALIGRSVDILTRRSVERSENWIRRKNILGDARIVYAR